MFGHTIRKAVIPAAAAALLLFQAAPVDAFLYHATGKSAARRILSGGVNPSKFSGKTRFGKGFYASRKPSTALAEKGESSSVLRMREGSQLKKNTWNFKNKVIRKLRSFFGAKKDLRGAVKNDVIGPKAARQVGKAAGKEGKAVEYRSAKNGGSNLFIPGNLFERRPNIVSPEKIVR
jgi:hypothetical protein